jgi:nonribosomal peptide synthetase DhbF
MYEYIGRDDLMVKCAGYRIELSEIETILYQHEHVREAVVVSSLNPEKENRVLNAFVVVDNQDRFSILGLKEYLCRSLPRYMIPESIEMVETLPKNANGKINRKKLQEIVQLRASPQGN